MSAPSATNALLALALSWLGQGAVSSPSKTVGRYAHVALLRAAAGLCLVAALACALGALWLALAPILGAAEALLAVAGVLTALALAAYFFSWRAPMPVVAIAPTPPANPAAALGATLARAAGAVDRQDGLMVLGALLAGVFVGGER